MILGVGAFQRWLGYKDRAFRNGISALIKDAESDPLSLLPCEDTTRNQLFATQKRVLTRTRSCWHLDLGLPVSQTVRNKFLLFTFTQTMVFLLCSMNRLRQALITLIKALPSQPIHLPKAPLLNVIKLGIIFKHINLRRNTVIQSKAFCTWSPKIHVLLTCKIH